MSRHLEEHIDLCAAYALGSLDPADRARLEEHLAAGCRPCELALAGFPGPALLLAAASTPARPSAMLRDRVLTSVATIPQEAPRPERGNGRGRVIELAPRRRSFGVLAWASLAAAAALAVATGLIWMQAGHLKDELAANRRELNQLEQRLAEEQRWAQVLNAPGARVAVLEPTPAGSHDLKARATYDPATRRAVVIFENFTPPAGRDYQLWAILGAAPASLGVIRVDQSGSAVLRLENVGDPAMLNAFAVSLEPTGGSPNPAAPSGPVVMLGKVSG